MSELIFVHRAGAGESVGILNFEAVTPSLLLWKTCRRQILFLENQDLIHSFIKPGDHVFKGQEAENFLAEILCGLHSSLIGETEVFGQFKQWWSQLPSELFWKKQNQTRIEKLFSLAKKVREEILCGCGSQSYGSLLRRMISPNQVIDLVGVGHLTQELIPWLQNNPYRLLCRNPHKVSFEHKAFKIETLDITSINQVVVIAAPLTHQELSNWLGRFDLNSVDKIFDLRSNSSEYNMPFKIRHHYSLQDFSTEKEANRTELEDLLIKSRQMISNWSLAQASKNMIRPFGWEDL